MLNKPIFSVITPTYNCRDYILKSYSCLKAQTEQNWEWIVVDDGSTDDSLEILKSIKDERLQLYTYEKNQGRGNARNYALNRVKGEVVVIWDMDDLYFPYRLTFIKDAIIDQKFDFFCSSAIIVDNYFNIKGARHFFADQILKKSFVHPTLAFHSKLLDKLKYGENMKIGEDVSVMVYLDQKCKGFYCEKFLMLYLEDREVNLEKTLLFHRNSRIAVKKLLKSGTLSMNFMTRLKYNFKGYLKSLILNSMRVAPSLYLKTVQFRHLEPFDINKITTDELNFINQYKNNLK